MKGQILANFVVEFSQKNEREMICHVECRPWKVFMDGTSSTIPDGVRLEHFFRLGFRASNNEAKYKALLVGLRNILGIGARDVEIYSDF